MTRTKPDLTFRYNQTLGRHGWLRLTPAYSIRVVQQILKRVPTVSRILDPFSGTGTTGLVAAEHNLQCDLIDINPFLVWFAQVKTTNYQLRDLEHATVTASEMRGLSVIRCQLEHLWVPPIYNINRWWPDRELCLLAQIHQEILDRFPDETHAKNLLLVAFCRLLIEASNAAFNHQSMSFKDRGKQQAFWEDQLENEMLQRFNALLTDVIQSAEWWIPGQVQVIKADARLLSTSLNGPYDCVITSPPYPNRMSYIRELRPYMYWLGYLSEARDAAELDWKAIGGTWGIATSRLKNWQPDGVRIQYPEFDALIARISLNSSLLANYVHKYFVDVFTHLTSLIPVLSSGARVFYIVGNSKFYDTLIPVDRIYAQLLTDVGFTDVKVELLRKRNSKKELYEYIVSAIKPI